MISFPNPATLFVCLLFASCGATAAEIQVKNSGDTPLAKAIASANAGDILVLAPGIYHEQVRLEKQLTLRGEPGAIIDGTTPLEAEWSAASGMDKVYVASFSKRPEGLLVDGKFIAEIRLDRAEKSGEWHWQTLLVKGPSLGGFKHIRALWMYHPNEKKIYLRLEDGAAPDKATLSFTPSRNPLIEIAAAGVVVEGLTLRGGSEAIVLGEGAKDSVIRRCKVTSYENTGIALTGGASSCTVEDCDITRGAFEEWRATTENRRENYEIWKIHKDVGKYDRVGIELIRAGTNNRILRNHLDRTFDGICLGDSSTESLDKPLIDPNHGRGTEIAENIIENTRDSGIELGVGCIDVNVHHNTLRHTHGGLRFKLPRIGPVFIHHNHLIDGTPFNVWFSMDSSPAEGYIYHNTITGGSDAAFVYSSFNAKRDFATPKWHILNNLILQVKDGFFDQRKGTPPRDFTESHNITTDDPSAAIGAGLDLSTYRQGKPLPGCEPGYFKAKAPDAGSGQ
ncbi:right-handed parallel beta-helix repeat-containing protein [Prosthecobacter sp.]|uniref:right-handed parallel beta-helix repeat-containing protein n=1 Tax=Prosthecobacter sp. TaxID=1965333 RepID=UPI0037847FD6